MAITATDPSPGTSYKEMAAATMPQVYLPALEVHGTPDLPLDVLKDLAKQKGVLDTVYITKTDTVIEQVTKVKWRKAPAPKPVVVRDTIRETHYYLAKQVGNKEGPTGNCITVYEVNEVDEICPENPNSSVELTNTPNSDTKE